MADASPQDFSNHSRASLIDRITTLEARLAALSTVHTPSPPPPSTKKVRPAKKLSKPFDPSRYHTRLIALKFAYLGGAYNGFEHHANNTTPLPTIEEELWKALRKVKLIFPAFRNDDGREDGVCWDGTDYSKCGRTDRGVSAFGQVIGVRVRSARPKPTTQEPTVQTVGGDVEGHTGTQEEDRREVEEEREKTAWDPIRDELPYVQLLNRVLPPDIRILAWCPDPGEHFSARFNCKERRYRYFFTDPAYATAPYTSNGEGRLDITAMREAAKKYEGLHDFRNLCKVDPSKQITNFTRRVFHAGIHEVAASASSSSSSAESAERSIANPKLYYFEVRGSAFLWHQVRHLVAVLFLVGQGYEKPSVVDELLDIGKTSNRPIYDMASDIPLVLWDCIFPEPSKVVSTDHGLTAHGQTFTGYEDSLGWIYLGDEADNGDLAKRVVLGVDDAKYGHNGIMDHLWALWRKRKMEEVLAGGLMELVSSVGRIHPGDSISAANAEAGEQDRGTSKRVFDGGANPRAIGTYIPLMQRARLEAPEVVNARYALRKGLNGASTSTNGDGVDE